MKTKLRRKLRKLHSKESTMPRDFPSVNQWGDRKAVCKRCQCIMRDSEPCGKHGEYLHPSSDKEHKPHWCPNSGKIFTDRDLEVLPFMRKARRRALKRLNVRP